MEANAAAIHRAQFCQESHPARTDHFGVSPVGVGPADVVRNRHAPGRLFTPNALAALAFEKMNYGRAVDFNDRFYEGKLLRADSARFVRLVIKGGNFFSLE